MAGMILCAPLMDSSGSRAGARARAITRVQCDFCDFPDR
jgi:hypothetical protein